jgi:ADP-ribose pyrophosphatase
MTESKKAAPPVELRRRRLATQNSKWDVFWDDITGADGSRVDSYLVIAPRGQNASRIGGTAILPVLPDGRVGLVRNYRHPLELDAWETPRGFLDPGEADTAAAALRELEEETGYISSRDDVIALGTFAQEPSTIAGMSALFAAENCRRGDKAPDFSEPGLGELAFFPLDEALDLADRGEIQDAATLLTIYRYAFARQRRQAR